MEGKFRILMTADTIGGVWTYTIDLCRMLGNQAEVHLLTMGRPADAHQKKQLAQLENVVHHESNYKLEWMENPWDDVAAAKKRIMSLYAELRPDIIHLNNFVNLDWKPECPVLTVFHSCVQTWWREVKGEKAPAEWNRYRRHVASALTLSDLVVFPTNAIRQAAEQVYGRTYNGKVIYNGSAGRASTHVKDKFILTAGRMWDEAKNIAFLKEVAPELPWPVYVAGSSDDETPVSNMKFLGHLSPHEMADYMANAAIFVMPSKYEPFGLAVLEAAQSGCALVLSDIGTFGELWHESAIFFDFDPRSATDAILQLCGSSWLLRRMAEAAEVKSRTYSARAMADNYLKVYSNLINTKSNQYALT